METPSFLTYHDEAGLSRYVALLPGATTTRGQERGTAKADAASSQNPKYEAKNVQSIAIQIQAPFMQRVYG